MPTGRHTRGVLEQTIQDHHLGLQKYRRLLHDSHSCMARRKQAFRLCGDANHDRLPGKRMIFARPVLKPDCEGVKRRMTSWVRGRCGCTGDSLCRCSVWQWKRLPAESAPLSPREGTTKHQKEGRISNARERTMLW